MNIIELNHIDLNSIGLNSKVIDGVGEPYDGKVKPYIKGHVTDGSSTFTFKVNGNDVTVSVNGGDWKYKPTAAITSLAFVGVPQLESLELNKITGVSTFNLDYPVVPMFKNCDATTEAALNYVYHIRGTATDDFDFTLKYIDESDNVTTVTESAVIDENGKWDVVYSGKKIKEIRSSFYQNTDLLTIEFTEQFDKCVSFEGDILANGAFRECTNLKSARFDNATFENITGMRSAFRACPSLETISMPKATFDKLEYALYVFMGCAFKELSLPKATFKAATSIQSIFQDNASLQTLNLPKATFVSCTNANRMILNCVKLNEVNMPLADFGAISSINEFAVGDVLLTDFFVPSNSSLGINLKLQDSPLTYESMLCVAGWLKDLTGSSAKTVTFKTDAYDALTAEQKAALTAIIVTEKGWNLATA